ncbi:hypothetical protein F4824DRAFT_470525 [Ustulina deusta]|nr:hypothetical protein F4824DRAFT_470525 [Ustulina deusta]
MCQDIQKVTFFCGHQMNFWWGKSRFCLFTGAGAARFHTTYVSFERNEEKCPRCKIGKQIRQQGKAVKRAEFRQAVEEEYAKTPDAYQEETARKWESRAATACSDLTAARIAELQLQIKESVVFFLEMRRVRTGGKIALLRAIVGLPEVFDRQALVTFFASRYFAVGDEDRKLQDWERTKLFGIARHAGVARTFKAGLNLKEPVPLPSRTAPLESRNKSTGSGGPVSESRAAGNRDKEGHVGMKTRPILVGY